MLSINGEIVPQLEILEHIIQREAVCLVGSHGEEAAWFLHFEVLVMANAW